MLFPCHVWVIDTSNRERERERERENEGGLHPCNELLVENEEEPFCWENEEAEVQVEKQRTVMNEVL